MKKFLTVLFLVFFTQSSFAFTVPVFGYTGKILQKGKETQHLNSVRNFLTMISDSKQKKYTKAEANKTLAKISQLAPSQVFLINTDKTWTSLRKKKTPLICTKPTLLKGVVIVGWSNGQVTKLKGNFKNLEQILKKLK